jgi:hypothetical protein
MALLAASAHLENECDVVAFCDEKDIVGFGRR